MLAHRLKQSSQICKKSAQPTSRSHSRDRQRRSALPSTAARTPYHLTGGAQIPIAQAVPLQSFSRGFLPWRFSDASRQHKSHVVSCGRHPKTFTISDVGFVASLTRLNALPTPPNLRVRFLPAGGKIVKCTRRPFALLDHRCPKGSPRRQASRAVSCSLAVSCSQAALLRPLSPQHLPALPTTICHRMCRHG